MVRFLKALNVTVDESTSDEAIAAQVRATGLKAVNDPDFRTQYLNQAKAAGLTGMTQAPVQAADPASVSALTAVSQKIAAALSPADAPARSALIRFLKAFDPKVDEHAGQDVLEANVRAIAGRAATDAAFRAKYIDQAKAAGLIA